MHEPAPPPVADAAGAEQEKKRLDLAALTDEQLLELRFCELELAIDGTELADHIAQLFRELESAGIRFRPHFWLSTEWFTPDGVPGIAIPFYMAHPRLARLEQNQMLEVEGGTAEWCMRILRHETGHAIDNAYLLRRRRRRQRLFGPSSQEYPDFYVPRPYSKSFVIHLDPSYAQSHPDEDFAESFAVWLTPGSEWRTRYADWPALRKLLYVDRVMREIGPLDPTVRNRRRVEPLSQLRKTLGWHYQKKRERFQVGVPDVYDSDLRRLFSAAPEFQQNLSAARFLSRVRREVRRKVAFWSGAYQYRIDQVFDDLLKRCRELNLRLMHSEEQTKLDLTIMLAVHTTRFVQGGGQRVWI